ncbi:MAG: hypothetical protein QOE45_3330 [Frankiaceae bacterium]|jgi:uncharacterized protein YdeI (YjbR/CyaY-like superfamily)|nr:hypothetical protein [Frankiaceae bacterium]
MHAMMPPVGEAMFFETPAALREWFAANAATATELFVGYRKKATGLPSVTWAESVDEALCVGWIDGVRRSLGEDAYTIRFTPRRRGSRWSAVNVRRVPALAAEGRMTPAGLAVFEARGAANDTGYSYERRDGRLPPEYEAALRRTKGAWEFWAAQPDGYRRNIAYWVTSAKQEPTRQRRLATLAAASARGERVRGG